MTRDSLSHHPAPKGEELTTGQLIFMLFTGPLAWFAQLCTGYALLSWPCYPYDLRLDLPLAGYGSARGIALLILLACSALAALSGAYAWRMLQSVKDEKAGGHEHLIHVGHGRTRFTALWGTILGAGFGLATLVTLVGFAVVPRCAG